MLLQLLQPAVWDILPRRLERLLVPVVIHKFKAEVQLGSQGLQHLDARIDHFRADTVGGDHGDFVHFNNRSFSVNFVRSILAPLRFFAKSTKCCKVIYIGKLTCPSPPTDTGVKPTSFAFLYSSSP